MADVLHRTTKDYRRSVSTPDYPSQDWIINPDLSAVAGQPVKYWTITGDVVSLMSQAERDAVDAAEAAAAITADKDANKAQLDAERVLRAVALVALDEFNLHAARIKSILDAIDNSATLAQVKAAILLIADPPQRTAQQVLDAIKAKVDAL